MPLVTLYVARVLHALCNGGAGICWGPKVLAEVVKWDGPMSNGDYKEAVVSRCHRLEGACAIALTLRHELFQVQQRYSAQLLESSQN